MINFTRQTYKIIVVFVLIFKMSDPNLLLKELKSPLINAGFLFLSVDRPYILSIIDFLFIR